MGSSAYDLQTSLKLDKVRLVKTCHRSRINPHTKFHYNWFNWSRGTGDILAYGLQTPLKLNKVKIRLVQTCNHVTNPHTKFNYNWSRGIEVKRGNFDESNREEFSYESQKNKRLINSSCNRYIYHVCIIDYIQTFNYMKKGEIILKTVFKNAK